SAGPYDGFFEGLAFKVGNRTVGANGARANVSDVVFTFDEGDLDIAFLGAFFGENLDANVFVIPGFLGVHQAFAVKNHGVRAGAFWIVFEGEIRGRDGEPVVCWGSGRGGAEPREQRGGRESGKKGPANCPGPQENFGKQP